MVSETFPRPNDDLVQTHRFGVRDRFFDKPSFFDPDAITESGFGIARHTVEPKGRIVRPAREEIVLAHYKYLGLDYIGERHAELNSRRRALDVEAGHGAHYDAESSRRNFARLFAQRVMVLPEDQGRLSRLRRRLFRAPIRAKAPTES
jgi:hypothetical protein